MVSIDHPISTSYVAFSNFFKENLKRHTDTTTFKIARYALLIIAAGVLVCKMASEYQARKKITIFCTNHPEFSKLIKKIQHVVRFDHVAAGSYGNKENSSHTREFNIGKNKEKHAQIYIKAPTGKNIFNRQKHAKNEQLAYLISHRLNLNVVPITVAIENFLEFEDVLPKWMLKFAKVGCRPQTYETSFAGVVIQEGVVLTENQDKFNQAALDHHQVQRAVLFNVITGRMDSGPNNTVIAEGNKMMELDNEQLGAQAAGYSTSWLITEYQDMVFTDGVIAEFLSKPAGTVEGIFTEMQHFNFPVSVQKNITNNFQQVREVFLRHQNQALTVKDLCQALAST